MRGNIRFMALASVAGIIAAGCGAAPAPSPGPNTHNTSNSSKSGAKPNTTSKGGLKVIGFYDQTMSKVAPDPFSLVKAHPGLVNYIAPFWYEVKSDGSILAKPEGNARKLAQSDHLPLMPLFNNAGGKGAFLLSATARTNAIHHIVSLVKTNHYAGVNIDFQMLKASDRSDLTLFMNSLAKALPKSTKISMSVVPMTSGNGESAAYDYKALDKDVSSMVLMAYDLHGDGTPPGPVSPYPWVIKSITTTLHAGVKPSKLYLGIANYGYLWTGSSTKAKTIPLKAMHQHKYGAYTWNSTQKEAYDKYTSGGVSHTIWFVNDRAAVDRIKLAKKYHLGGVAFWRIGYEDAKWWNAVSGAIKGGGSGTTTSGAGSSTSKASKKNAHGTKAVRVPSPKHTIKKIAPKVKMSPSPNKAKS